MIGRRQPQRSLFEAQAWPHRVPADSFNTRLGAVMEQLFVDDDLAGMRQRVSTTAGRVSRRRS